MCRTSESDDEERRPDVVEAAAMGLFLRLYAPLAISALAGLLL
jgi:hypothetical protein